MTTPATISPSQLGRTTIVHERRLELLLWLDNEKYEPPMNLGGTDASYHSGYLTRLVVLGLAERKRFYRGMSGGHWRYRRSQAGRDWLAAHDHIRLSN